MFFPILFRISRLSKFESKAEKLKYNVARADSVKIQ